MTKLDNHEPPRRAAALARFGRPAGLWLAVAAAIGIAAGHAAAGAPPANTEIGNQASATYTDAAGNTRTTTSNTVRTTVLQVASLALAANASKTAPIGGSVVYAHTLTNTGNGTDTFALSFSQSGALTLNNVQFFADANGDGIADDPAAPIASTGSLAAGALFKFVITGTVPAAATAGQQNVLTVSAASGFTAGVTASVTDTTTVSTNAIVNVTKEMDITSGAPATGPYTIKLRFTNVGNVAATTVVLTDALPSGMTYVAGTGRWSTSGTTPLTDADDAGVDPAGIKYKSVSGVVTAEIATLAAGQSGDVTFKVNVASGLAAGANPPTANKATYQYDDGTGGVGPFDTNTVQFVVLRAAAVTANDDPLQAGDASLDDVVAVASAAQGATVTFANRIHNGGNFVDSYDVSFGSSTFPAGTTFQLFRADGLTPLVDSTGDGVPDTGPVAVGTTFTAVLAATLPPGATGGPFTVVVTARSAYNAATTDTVTDRLAAISTSVVDLTNDKSVAGGAAAGDGLGQPGAGGEASPVRTLAVGPNATATFMLFVNNTAGPGSTYNLSVQSGLPAGWSVKFFLDDGTGAGNATRDASDVLITNTGVVNAGGNARVFADVSVKAGQTPGDFDLVFKVESPTSGAADYKKDRVTVNTVRSITITPNNTGQVFSGGSVVYTHTLANTGNVTEGGAFSTISFAVANSAAATGWTSVVYQDDGNGVLDGSDSVAASLSGTILSGATKTLFVKVFAPAGAAVGAVDVATLTVSTANGSHTTTVPAAAAATDATTVIPGDVALLKEQALDENNDGTPEGAFTTGNLSQEPGQGVIYRITVTNTGSGSASSVVVTDATPAFTRFKAASTTQGSVTTQPAVDANGTIQVAVGTLTPGASAVVTIRVQVEP